VVVACSAGGEDPAAMAGDGLAAAGRNVEIHGDGNDGGALLQKPKRRGEVAEDGEAAGGASPGETAEGRSGYPGDVTAEAPLIPPPGSVKGIAGAATVSQGAAAAMLCQWLPITLPPPPPSMSGGGSFQAGAEANTQAGVAGSGSSPVVGVEALESPQDTALLKRKADRESRGK